MQAMDVNDSHGMKSTELGKAVKAAVAHVLPGHGMSVTSEDAAMQATAKVFGAIQGHWLSACLGVMLQLKIADILVDQAGSSSSHAIAPAGQNGAPAAANGHASAASDSTGMSIDQHEMLDEHPGRKFTPNAATVQLVQGEDPSLGHMASHLINPPKWDAWKVLPQAVQQGKTAFVLAHGMDVYEYGEAAEHAGYGEEFMKAMSYFTRHSLAGGATSLKDAYDWAGARVVLDVGGGRGELLSSAMSWAGQQCRGLLLDRQMVIDSIDIPGMFEAKGVTGAAGRLTLMSGDVRQPFPQQAQQAQVDTLLMKHFLSAFSDEDCALILKHCREVLAPGGSILLLQTLVPEAGDRQHNTCEDGVAPGLFAIEILAQCPGGAWRTLSEWQALFSAAGLRLAANTTVGCNMNLMTFKAQ
ncbi:S-adenosyl-L-methionine-dependent methyltransferase [Scenedesmus sp. NREL 46B-D3]|nr:S-adenosyl-L-methionine-dependent methyltransferase [Scenedesmus sp. NREL 46B-D3]